MLFVSRIDENSQITDGINLDLVEKYQFQHPDPKKKIIEMTLTLSMTSGEKIELKGFDAENLYTVMGSNRFHYHAIPNPKAEAKRKKALEEQAAKDRAEFQKRQEQQDGGAKSEEEAAADEFR